MPGTGVDSPALPPTTPKHSKPGKNSKAGKLASGESATASPEVSWFMKGMQGAEGTRARELLKLTWRAVVLKWAPALGQGA